MIRGYGFVTMATTEQAAAAIAALDKQVLNGRMIKVAWGHSGAGVAQWADNGNTNWGGEANGGFDPYPPNLGGTPPGYHFKNFNSVYVKFSSTKPNMIINEITLTRIFQAYGDVIDVSIKSMVLNNASNVSGFAFIHFADSNEGKDSAMRCSLELQNKVVGKIEIFFFIAFLIYFISPFFYFYFILFYLLFLLFICKFILFVRLFHPFVLRVCTHAIF